MKAASGNMYFRRPLLFITNLHNKIKLLSGFNHQITYQLSKTERIFNSRAFSQ